MFNPIIISKVEEKIDFLEGCLSIKNKRTNTKTRSKTIVVKWQDKTGAYNKKEFTDISSVILQHEIDHLNGVLMSDYNIKKPNDNEIYYPITLWESLEYEP